MEALEVLQKVDAFYRTSWEHLLVFGGIAAFVVGVLVPFLFLLYQRRLFNLEEATVTQKVEAQVEKAKAALAEAYKQEHASLRDEVAARLATAESKLDDALATLRQELRKEHAEEFESLRGRLDKAFASTKGSVFHVQGVFLSRQREFPGAALSLLAAALGEATGRDGLNLGRSLKMLCDDCLPNVYKQDIAEMPDFLDMVSKLEEAFKPLNQTGAYLDRIRILRAAIEAAQSREKPAPLPKR